MADERAEQDTGSAESPDGGVAPEETVGGSEGSSERTWTLRLEAGDGGPAWRYTLSARGLRRLAFGAVAALTVSAAVVAGSAVALATGLVPGVGWDLYPDPVTAAVQEGMGEVNERVQELEGELERLEDREARLRALAGLDDGDVMADAEQVMGDRRHHLHWMPPDLEQLEPRATDETAGGPLLGGVAERSRLLADRMDVVSDSLNSQRVRMRATPSLLPASGFVSSGFSSAREHPIHQEARPHTGVDLSAPYGTPVRAAAAGEVRVSGYRAGYGRTVEIDHGEGYRTLYGHAAELQVEAGDWVERGDVIATVGSSGNATSPHLHYEVHVDGEPVDPQQYLAAAPATRD